MPSGPLDQELLLAVRRSPNRTMRELASAVGLPRTNFGRQLSHPLRGPVGRLLADGLIEERHGRYRLSERGRRVLAEREVATRG
jgi:predicted transcriptional regulator